MDRGSDSRSKCPDDLETNAMPELAASDPADSTLERLRRQITKLAGFSLTVGASFGTFGFFAIQGIILARVLGPADRGVFAAAVLFPQVLLYLGLLGATELFAGYAAEDFDNAELRRSAAIYGAFAGLVSAVLCVLLNFITIPDSMRHVLPWAMLCAATMPLQQIRLSVQAVDHGQRNFQRYNVVRLLGAAAFPVLLCIGWANGIATVPQAVMLFVAAQVIALFLVRQGMDESWIGPRAVPLLQSLKNAKGLIGAWISTELLERLDLVLVMVLIASDETLGFYSSAVPMAALMIIVPNAAGLYAFNRGSRAGEHLSPRDAYRFIGMGLAVQVLSALVLAAILPILIPLFYGDEFMPTVRFAWLLLPAGIFRGLLQAADSYMRARKKPGIGIVGRLIAVPVLLAFSFWGRESLGDAAIPVGLSAAQCVCFCIVAGAVVRDTHISAGSAPASTTA
ncbi:MAG: lipopolysaccharide biosynthesis protein [Aureliella sp.]